METQFWRPFAHLKDQEEPYTTSLWVPKWLGRYGHCIMTIAKVNKDHSSTDVVPLHISIISQGINLTHKPSQVELNHLDSVCNKAIVIYLRNQQHGQGHMINHHSTMSCSMSIEASSLHSQNLFAEDSETTTEWNCSRMTENWTDRKVQWRKKMRTE